MMERPLLCTLSQWMFTIPVLKCPGVLPSSCQDPETASLSTQNVI